MLDQEGNRRFHSSLDDQLIDQYIWQASSAISVMQLHYICSSSDCQDNLYMLIV